MTLNNLKLNRVLVCKMFALFFGLALLPLYSNGQSWETVRSENFNGVTNSFSVIPDFTQVGFSPFPGQARSVLNNNFIYAAFQAQLDPTYEYRFSWNIKGNSSGKKVVFKLGTASGTTGTDVSGVFSLSNTFVVRQSNAFTVPQNGNYFLIATPPPSGYSAALLQVYFDDFLLERRALPMPVINFAAAEVTIAEGGSTQICVSVDDPPLVTFSADVALSGSADPHLSSSYTTQTLNFPAGSTTPQCFTLQLEPANGIHDQNHTYTLELQNLTGGATEGTPSSLTVTVTDDVPNAPAIEFQAPEITIAEGGSTSVCISVTTPSAGFTADVVLTSSADPHFTNFTTQNLIFPAGSASQQCFTLQLEPANGQPDLNHTYTFELQNLTGGAVLGEATAMVVTVTDDEALLPGCPWAGEDRAICIGNGVLLGCPETTGSEGYCYRWLP